MTIVHFIPSIIGIFISFFDFSSAALRDWSKAEFIGLDNYARIFSGGGDAGEKFLESAKASLIYTVSSLVLIFVIGLFAAKLLNH